MSDIACSASILLVAKDNPESLLAQLQSLDRSGLSDGVELVVVADAAGPAVKDTLGRLGGRVRLLASAVPVGRRAALASAAAAAEGEVCVALGPLARVTPGFLDPLVEAVRAGAGMAAPALDTVAGPLHGYRAEEDGSLVPLGPGDAAADALALDCLAARRELWVASPRAYDHWRDHYEVSLARAARGFGPLVVVPDSRVARDGSAPALSVVVCGDASPACAAALQSDGLAASGGEVITAADASAEALDAAVAAARHDILVFVDAATRPGPGWATHLAEAFHDPGVALARGPVRGLWPDGSDPNRVPLAALDLVGIVDHGDADIDLDHGREGGFPNLAVRREAIETAGGFAEMAATGGGARLDALLAFAVRRQGGRCRYASQAAVGTVIAPERAHDATWPHAEAFRTGAQEAALQDALGVSDPLPALGARLADVAPLPDALAADDLVARIVDGPGMAIEKLDAVRAVGALAARTVAAGGDEARLVSGTVVSFESRHADGEMRAPAARETAAAPRVTQAPLVSCVIPVFNLERYVGSTIQSVLDQRYPAEALDIVVIDDGSSDGTSEVCAAFGDRIRYIRQDNAGVIAAVDRGVREARGEFIGFLDADDQWLPDKTRRQVDFMGARPDVGLLYGDMELIDEADRTIHASFWGSAGVVPYRGRMFANILRWNFVTTGSMLARASLRDAFCPMPPASPWQDWGIASAIARVAPLDYLPEPMFRYRQHDENHALGAEGEQLVRAQEKELRFRRAMYAELAAGEVRPYDLRALINTYIVDADRLAQARGTTVGDDDRVRSGAQLGAALEALAAGDLERVLQLVFDALVHNPGDQQAHDLFEATYERLSRRREGRASLPLEWPGDRHAADRLLADCAGFTVLAHAAELIADDALLESFATAFGAGEATLVAYSPDLQQHELFEALAAAVGRAGLDRDDAPDVVLFDTAATTALEERLAARAGALLTRRTEASALGALPGCGDAAALLRSAGRSPAGTAAY